MKTLSFDFLLKSFLLNSFLYLLPFNSFAESISVNSSDLLLDTTKTAIKDTIKANWKDSTEWDFYPKSNKRASKIHSLNSGDNDSSRVGFWINGGKGLSSMFKGSFIVGGSLNLNHNSFLISLKIDWQTNGGVFAYNLEGECTEIAFLLGLAKNEPPVYYSFSTGTSLLNGFRQKCTSWFFVCLSYTDHEEINQIGFPLDVQLFLRPVSFIGIGLNGFATITNRYSFWGAMLCLQAGKFW